MSAGSSWAPLRRARSLGRRGGVLGRAHLPIKDMLKVLAALRALREVQLAAFGGVQATEGYLAIDAAGQPLDPRVWTKRWVAACEPAGIAPKPLHAARHTSVTMMRDAGVPDHIVAGRHGHDESLMRGTYTHSQADELAKAGAALAGVLSQFVVARRSFW